MGNHRFRLSDMMPNAWFYKLKDIGTKPRKRTTWSTSQPSKKKYPTTDEQPPQHFTQHRNSYYFTSTESFISSHKLHNSPINPKVSDVHFPDPPRKSSKRRSRRRSTMNSNSKLVSSVSAGCSCRVSLDSVWAKPTDSAPDSSYFPSPDPSLHECTLPEFETQPHSSSWPSSPSCSPPLKFHGLDSVPVLELPPILTKPAKVDDVTPAIKNREVGTIKTRRSLPVKENTVKKTHKQNRTSPRCSAISPGVKIRPNSPKIASKKIQAYCRKSSIANTKLATSHRKRVSESYAIIKSSTDPWRDFKESMVEMIVENNIRASKDLEDLLACYLSLNSNEYHDVIVKVFEQIWFDLVDIQLVKFSF